jgi:hypothetical protein
VDLNKLTVPERALWQAFPGGELVDLTRTRGVRARTIRAEVIAALLLGAVPPEPGKIAAIQLDGARVTGALSLGHAVITGPVRVRPCEFEATIDLSGAKARGIDLEGSKLAGLLSPLGEFDGNLSLIQCQCLGQVVLTGAHITGALQMQRTRLDYPPAQRVEWLRRDADGYLPQNYETLAAMYRRLGDDASARVVLLAKERERRAQLPWYGRAWSWLQEITVGYGYRPLRATAWLAAFVALGTLAFGLHHPPPFQGTAHPAFNPFIYTVDLSLTSACGAPMTRRGRSAGWRTSSSPSDGSSSRLLPLASCVYCAANEG